MAKDSIGMSSVQRIMLSIALKEKVEVSTFFSPAQKGVLGKFNSECIFFVTFRNGQSKA